MLERDKRGVILGNDGVGIAGDALNGEIVMAVVAPRLGLGIQLQTHIIWNDLGYKLYRSSEINWEG